MARSIRAGICTLLFLCSLIGAPPRSAAALPMDGCPALGDATAQVMIDVDSTFARAAPDFSSGTTARLIKFQCFFAVGRHSSGGFILVQDGNTRIWVFGRDVAWRGDLTKLPVMDDYRVSAGAALKGVPRGLPAISARARQLYVNSAGAGRDYGIVSVIGDCNSESPVFLGRLAGGGFNAAAYPNLAAPIARFARSFGRTSLATSGSFNTGSALDPTWANPTQCKEGETPLACELRVSRASILIVSLGTGDQFAWQSFDARYRRILDETILRGVLPVLMTKADALESAQGGAPADFINAAVRRLGAEYGLPVIDLALGAADLPNHGLANEPAPQFHLSEEGLDLRLVMTLATLDAVTRGVRYTPPPAQAAAGPALPPAAGGNAQPAAGLSGATFVVGDAVAMLRAAPAADAAAVGSAERGARFSVLAASPDGSWLQVRATGDGEAWTSASAGVLIPSDAATAMPLAELIVVRAVAILRDSGAADAREVERVQTGQTLRVFERSPDDAWLRVALPGASDYRWMMADQGVLLAP